MGSTVQELRAGSDRRREPAGIGALGAVRRQPRSQYWQQPLALQAGFGTAAALVAAVTWHPNAQAQAIVGEKVVIDNAYD